VRVVDRWPSPRALLVLALPSGDGSVGLRGTSRSIAPWGRVDQWPGPHDLRISFEDAFQLALFVPPLPAPVLLTRGPAILESLGEVNSSHGVVKVRPSIDINTRCPLPVASLLRRAAVRLVSVRTPAVRRDVTIGLELPPSRLVPPLPFCPAATVYSTSCLPGLLRPGADHGVRQVSASASSSVPFPAGLLRVGAVSPPGPFPTPRGLVWTSPRWSGVSSEEATAIPFRRPARPMVAWASPLALHPSKLFPCRQLVPRQPSSRPRPGSFGRSQVNLVLPSLARHCSRLVRATAVHSLSPLFPIRARLPATIRERRVACLVCSDRSLGLRALFHRQVRNDTLAFPPTCRPMLPWASFFRGLASVLRRTLLVAVPMCRSTRPRTPKHPSAIRGERASCRSGRSRSPWRTRWLTFRVLAIYRLLAVAGRRSFRFPADPTGAHSRRSAVPEGATWASRPAVVARRRLRGDPRMFRPDAPVLHSEECAVWDSRSRSGTNPGVWVRRSGRTPGMGSQQSTWPRPCRLVRRVRWGSGACWFLAALRPSARRRPGMRAQRPPKWSRDTICQDPRTEARGCRYLGACASARSVTPLSWARPRPRNRRRVAITCRCPSRSRRGRPPRSVRDRPREACCLASVLEGWRRRIPGF
jgi:hypothetical protein